MIVRKTKPEEARRTEELFSIAFELPLENDGGEPESERFTHYSAFEEDDRTMMSTFVITEFTVNFDGSSCKMGGVGGVATLPQYRRRGGIRGCFELALPDLYEKGYDFSYLYPFSTAYYRKFGFETFGQKLGWKVDLSLWQKTVPEGSWVLAERSRPLAEEIRYLDGLWERRYNMMVVHGPGDYEWTEKTDPIQTREYTYVCFDGTQTPKAYTTFRTVPEGEGRNLVCSRFCFDGKEGFLLLMGLFKTMASDHRYVKFQTPMEKAFQYYALEWSLGAAQWEILANSGMVRVINVPAVLKKASCRGTGEVVLAVSDSHIPENNGTWQVRFREGKCISVTKTDLPPDAVFTIQAFSALICGALDWEDGKEALDGIQVRKDENWDQLFYRKKMMITDYF